MDCAHPIFLLSRLFFFFSFFFLALLRGVVGWLKDFSLSLKSFLSLYCFCIYINLTLDARTNQSLSSTTRRPFNSSLSLSLLPNTVLQENSVVIYYICNGFLLPSIRFQDHTKLKKKARTCSRLKNNTQVRENVLSRLSLFGFDDKKKSKKIFRAQITKKLLLLSL